MELKLIGNGEECDRFAGLLRSMLKESLIESIEFKELSSNGNSDLIVWLKLIFTKRIV